MPIVWKDNMSLGNELIDADHRYLFALINLINFSFGSEKPTEYLLLFMDQLVDYSKFHFQREEIIQKGMSYPLVQSHKTSHDEIVRNCMHLADEVREYAKKKDAGESTPEADRQMSVEVNKLLRAWILDHVLVEDKRMEYYLRKQPRNFM